MPGYYYECAKTALWQTGDMVACLVKCQCAAKCDYLYFKFEPLIYENATGARLCEITQNGVYGPVEPVVGNSMQDVA